MAVDVKRILVAEDEVALAEAIKGWFEFMDDFNKAEIVLAHTAEDTENGIMTLQPDITILDLGLGDGLRGLSILKKVRGMLPDRCKIFIHSGYMEHRDECMTAGATDFFDKKLSFNDMIGSIRRHMTA